MTGTGGKFCFVPNFTNRHLFLALLFISCGNQGQSVYPGTEHKRTDVQKIVITRNQVYDLSGYADEGQGSPWGLFDENALVDPRYIQSASGFEPVTNCQPTQHKEIYFGIHGSRVVVDLVARYQVKEIWIYDRSSAQDSLWLSTGSLRKWDQVAALRTNGLLQKRGWKKIEVGRNTRFVQITFSSPATAITEMVLYGSRADSAALPGIPETTDWQVGKTGRFTSKSLNRFLGVNYIIEEEPRWLKPFHYSRLYNVALDYDTDTIHEGKEVRFNMLHYGQYDAARNKYVFLIDTLQKINNGNIWYSVRGVSQKMSQLGFGEKDRPLDRPGMDAERSSSYSRHARMMWNLAAFFGFTRVDTNKLSLSHHPLTSGRGRMHLFENGNEEDAWWEGKKYGDPVSVFAQSSADWDGDEGRLGEGTGIHQADSNARLMMSGLIGLDTNRVKVYRFLSEQLRDDRRFPWTGGIQYHHYSNRDDHGISPEEDNLRQTLSAVRNTTRRIAPDVECFLGEIGYDKSRQSTHAAPLLPGYTSAQSQAIMLLRTINACFFSGFDATVLYWLKDGDPETDARTYLTSGLLRNLGNGKTLAYPSWYQVSGMVNALGNYIPDSIVSEKGEVWIYRYRNALHPDSLACVAWSPTVTGMRVSRFRFDPGPRSGPVTEAILSDSSDVPVWRKISSSDGIMEVEIGEKPSLFFWRR